MVRTILLADDSPTIRRVVELTFGEREFRVQSVASGAEALRRLERFRPDLVLADVAMPEPSGYEVCETVKRSGRPVPVILLAGAFEAFDEDRVRICGADDCIVKPFDPRALVERVETLLAESSAHTVRAGETSSAPVGLDSVNDVVQLPDTREEIRASPPQDSIGVAGLPPGAFEAIVAAVIHRLSERAVRELAGRIVPDVAERIVRERIRELEAQDLTKEKDDRGTHDG